MASMSLPPGFRFHPTDEELVGYYLKRKINGRTIELEIISEVDLYKCEPWDLPEKSLLPGHDMEWYFFSPMDRKYPNGSRTNRATKAGYWKATGKDRLVCSQRRPLGMKKTLVYYTGRAPHGSRTNWVMHEYRLDEHQCEARSGLQDAYSLCRVFKKNGAGPKIVEMHGIRSYVEPLDQCTSDLHDYSYSTIHDTFSSELGRTGEDIQNIFYTYNNQQELQWAPFNTTNSCTEDIKLLVPQQLNTSTDRCFPITSDNFVCHPSMKTQVDVAVECAKLQRRLSLPELEMESVPQFEFLNSQDRLPSNYSQRVGADQPDHDMINMEDIFSNAFASREQMYDSKELGMSEWEDDHGLPSLTEFGSENRDQLITINYEEIIIQKMGSSESSQTSNHQLLEGPNSVMIESISSFQDGPKLSIDKGRIKQHDNVSKEGNNFGDQSCCSDYLGIVSDGHPHGYFTECNEDAEEYCLSTLDYEMGKKIEVNHGMLTVTRYQQADTIFHEVEPCRTVCLHSSDELMESTKAGWLKAVVRDLVEAVEKILVL